MESLYWITLLVGGIWLAIFVISLVSLFRSPVIRPAKRTSQRQLPLVSVIVPARNEEENIVSCLRSLLEQDHRDVEVIVVDDNSQDATALLVERMGQSDHRVRLVKAGPLPPGWTGKCHALYTGVNLGKPRGEWLLFTDADTVHRSQSISATLQVALDRQLDLVSLVPQLQVQTFWEKLMQPTMVAIVSLFYKPGPMKGRNVFANGQYILVRKEAYLRAGGHQAVKGKVLEDTELARRIVASGGRGLLALGYELFSTRMYRDLHSLWEGWVKNIFLIMTARTPKVLGTVILLWLLSFWPAVAGWGGLALLLAGSLPVQSWWWCWTAMGIYAEVLFFQMTLRRLNHWPPVYALAAPLGGFLAILICWRSMMAHLKRSGVSWKGRVYKDGA